ncbi:hypothetical protein RE6C_00305 [Rhodopirellula europaea 6C]|uniref:Uncharacterized protein n=1 Tax=Rhodopirellula europaea 6C TaxID=1263867 RepID=M2APG6_9BACT|nr:hypothetical protein RE6C_00305 [Rhodopirellula europaea 6C]
MGHKLQLGWRTAGGDEKYTASELCSRGPIALSCWSAFPFDRSVRDTACEP